MSMLSIIGTLAVCIGALIFGEAEESDTRRKAIAALILGTLCLFLSTQ